MEYVVEIDPERLEKAGLDMEKVVRKLTGSFKSAEFEAEGYTLIVRPKKVTKLSDLRKIAEKVKKHRLKGLSGVGKTIIRKEGDEYVIYTEGSNFKQVLKVPGVTQRGRGPTISGRSQKCSALRLPETPS